MHELLVKAREASGLKQHEVAKKLGIDPGLLSNMESGKRSATRAQLDQFASLYNRPVSDFLLPWLVEKIENLLEHEPLATEALHIVLSKRNSSEAPDQTPDLKKLLHEMEAIKAALRGKI